MINEKLRRQFSSYIWNTIQNGKNAVVKLLWRIYLEICGMRHLLGKNTEDIYLYGYYHITIKNQELA